MSETESVFKKTYFQLGFFGASSFLAGLFGYFYSKKRYSSYYQVSDVVNEVDLNKTPEQLRKEGTLLAIKALKRATIINVFVFSILTMSFYYYIDENYEGRKEDSFRKKFRTFYNIKDSSESTQLSDIIDTYLKEQEKS